MKITLKNLHEATDQQVFDQVANHLLTQQQKSTHASGNICLYRGHDGSKCAAGCLISDSEYKESMEGRTWEGLFSKDVVPEYHRFLIWSLQHIHDTTSVESWKKHLETLSTENNLEFKF